MSHQNCSKFNEQWLDWNATESGNEQLNVNIGQPGQPWGDAEKHAWRVSRRKQRNYFEDVVPRVERLRTRLQVEEYGALDYAQDGTFPLFVLKSSAWDDDLPYALITGGVHGYETSGVEGALQFAEQHAGDFEGRLNLVIAPCVSPWAYERIQRWNALAMDPNRNFVENSKAPESAALIKMVAGIPGTCAVHIDLHETTDTDETEFRPALAALQGKPSEPGTIPDGFYVVGDTPNPQLAFQSAVIEAVRPVTHIAPADPDGTIIGSEVVAEGVILYDFKALGLCAGVTDARFTTTTEVYPDSPRATPTQCNDAQVAAVIAALQFALA